MTMMLGVLAVLAQGPFAVFWSGDSTYVVDAGAGQMHRAPGWYATDDDGQVWRYRLRVEAHRHRKGLEGETWPASRWTVLEKVQVGERAFEALTPAPRVPAPGQGYVQAEYAMAQFRGEAASLLLRRRTYDVGGVSTHVEAWTIQLPGGHREATPRGSGEALSWLGGRLPEAVEACVQRPVGALTWEQPGGRLTRQLVLGPNAETCAERLATLPLGEVMDTGGGLEWWQDRGAPGPDDLRDARPNADLDHALLLRGPKPPPSSDLRVDACAQGAVSLWRGDQPPKVLGAAERLDGARWVPPRDPLIGQLPLRFRPVGAPPCLGPMRLHRRLPDPPRPQAHLCGVDEEGRAWAGPADLAASAVVAAEGDRLHLTVVVTDPDRHADDGVDVWLGGDQRRAIRFRVQGDRVDAWGNRATRRRIKAAVDARWQDDRRGYRLDVSVPLPMAGATPAVAVRVNDSDPDVPGQLGLWAGGQRISDHTRRPVACEAR